MSNLRSLNQQHSFWDWANSFDETNAGPSGWDGWSRGHADSAAPPPPVAGREHDRSTPPPSGPHEHGHPRHGRHGSQSPGPHEHSHTGRHGHHNGPRGGHGGHGGHGRGGPCGGGRGRRGPPFGRGFPGGPWGGFGGSSNAGFDMSSLATWLQDLVGPQQPGAKKRNDHGDAQDFTPSIDIFSTEEAYIIHASLPGAAKEDIAVTWDAASSTLVLTGVVHRPGDEQLLKALEVMERDVGAFERKIVLGTKDEPAKVDEDAISAKLEHGILRVEVPKLGQEEAFVEVKKVDIE